MRNKGSGWKGESRRHSLARKGVKTVLPDGRRFDVSKFVANGYTNYGIGDLYINENRGWDNLMLVIDKEGDNVLVGHIDDKDYWENDEETLVDIFVMTVDELDDENLSLVAEYGKPNMDFRIKYMKQAKELLNEMDYKTQAKFHLMYDTDYAYDLAERNNEIYDNVKHMRWFKNLLEVNIEHDDKMEKVHKEKNMEALGKNKPLKRKPSKTKKDAFQILKEYNLEKYTDEVYKEYRKESKFWNKSTFRNAILSTFDELNKKNDWGE